VLWPIKDFLNFIGGIIILQPSFNPLDTKPTWQQWLQRLIASLSLVAALTAALVNIEPLLQGHIDWIQILLAFLVIFVFTALHSATSMVSDPALRAALNVILTELQQLLSQSEQTLPDKDTMHHDVPPRAQLRPDDPQQRRGYPYNS
jgi:glycerol uptake facilitator-like aquaporin